MNPVREALYSLLSGDAELSDLAPGGIWHRRADQEAAMPYVVFHRQASAATMRTYQGPAARGQVWMVKGVCRGGDAQEAEEIDARVEAILEGAELTIDGEQLLLEPMRTEDLDYGEGEADENVHNVGGLYRLVTEPA